MCGFKKKKIIIITMAFFLHALLRNNEREKKMEKLKSSYNEIMRKGTESRKDKMNNKIEIIPDDFVFFLTTPFSPFWVSIGFGRPFLSALKSSPLLLMRVCVCVAPCCVVRIICY